MEKLIIFTWFLGWFYTMGILWSRPSRVVNPGISIQILAYFFLALLAAFNWPFLLGSWKENS